jgi:hypothetical protein
MKRYIRNPTGPGGQMRGTVPRLSTSTQGLAPSGAGFATVGAPQFPAMYVVELSLKLSPMPVAVQRRELADAQALYGEVRQALEGSGPRVLELSCEKEENKRISLLSSEVVAVAVYEKSAVASGGKRPGFSFDN